LRQRPDAGAGMLHALHVDSSLIAMPAGKHRVRLRRYEVTHLDFARTGHIDVDPHRIAITLIDEFFRDLDGERERRTTAQGNARLALVRDHNRRSVGPGNVLNLYNQIGGLSRKVDIRQNNFALDSPCLFRTAHLGLYRRSSSTSSSATAQVIG
jgi:hypothetical protein